MLQRKLLVAILNVTKLLIKIVLQVRSLWVPYLSICCMDKVDELEPACMYIRVSVSRF